MLLVRYSFVVAFWAFTQSMFQLVFRFGSTPKEKATLPEESGFVILQKLLACGWQLIFIAFQIYNRPCRLIPMHG